MPDGYTARDDIISAPAARPTNLVITRGNGSMELKWGIPAYLVDGEYKKNREITYIDVWWSFDTSQDMDRRWTEVRNGGGSTIADRLWIRDLGTSARSHTQAFDRNRYYPIDNRKLTSVCGWVVIDDTVNHAIDSQCQSLLIYRFRNPYPPILGTPTFDGDENKVSFPWEFLEDAWTSDGYDHERYDVHWQISRKDNMETRTEELLDEDIVTNDSGTAVSPVIEGADSLLYDQWIDMHFRARARGFAGDSPEVHILYTIAHPPRATIWSIKYDIGLPSPLVPMPDYRLITVCISTNANAYHPVDTVELQRAADNAASTYRMARLIPNASWDTVATSNDADCSGLVDSDMTGAMPTAGKHTWYRIKTTRCGYVQYSDPMMADELEQLSPVLDDDIEIASVTPQDDGTSLRVVMGWDDDDSNGTEVSWSQYADAWQSTSPPTSFDWDDSHKDSQSQVSGRDNSSVLVIRDLEEGKPYYVRARRYYDGETRVYSNKFCSAPSGTYPISPMTEAQAVHLSGPVRAMRSQGAVLTWTLDSEAEQKSWVLYRVWEEAVGSGQNIEVVEKREVVGFGDDQTGSFTVKGEQMGSSGDASFVVAVTTGGEWSESEKATVVIYGQPTLTISADSVLDAQPMSFSFVGDSPNLDVVAKVIADGTASGTPNGELVQATGDVLWSERFTPSWVQSLTNRWSYSAEHTLPTGLAFVDGARYRLICTAVDRTTGFSSASASAEFSVDWDHKASPPDSDSTVTPDVAGRTARIHPIAPEGAAQTDVYDLYRVTNDSVDLIAEGQAFGVDAIDRFAPYSRDLGLMYRIATRTADGDVQWADFDYEMPVGAMRFDWGEGQYVELPYNIALQDSYEKNYEAHQHMDGSVSGHWNPGFSKTGTYSTDVIKVRDADQVKLVREMATYPGAVFVRTQDGGAFEANVSIGVDASYSSGAAGVSLNIQGHSLSDAFRLVPSDFVDTTGA